LEQPINNKEIEQFGSLELIARQVVEGFITGLHKSPFHGFPLSLPNTDFTTKANLQDILTGNYSGGQKSFLSNDTKKKPICVVRSSSTILRPCITLKKAIPPKENSTK